MTIKKAFVPLLELLEANKNKKVEALLPQILALVTAKQLDRTFAVNDAGEVTHIYCYYHKKWEALADVEYGAKKHSTHGYNTMCKEGVNAWTKQQRDYRVGLDQLLTAAIANKYDSDALTAQRLVLESARQAIIARKDGLGTDEL